MKRNLVLVSLLLLLGTSSAWAQIVPFNTGVCVQPNTGSQNSKG